MTGNAPEIPQEEFERKLKALADRGLKAQVDSWVGTGPNLAVTPEQLITAIGEDTLARAAKESGKPVRQLAEEGAERIPLFIDRATPDGDVTCVGSETRSVIVSMIGDANFDDVDYSELDAPTT